MAEEGPNPTTKEAGPLPLRSCLKGGRIGKTESVETVAATIQADTPRPMKRDKNVLAIAHEAGWVKYRTNTRRTMASRINTVKLRRLLPDNTMW